MISEREIGNAIKNKDIDVLIKLANVYLNINGFPEENNLNKAYEELECDSPELNQMIGYNYALQNCKLAVIKNIEIGRSLINENFTRDSFKSKKKRTRKRRI